MSSASRNLARLTRVDLREVWPGEASDFTPWLAEPENLRLLGKTLGIELEDAETEEDVGRFSADLVATSAADKQQVLVENQLERTDHSHLGQILTYAAGLEAVTVVWIAKEFTDEHRAALDWLNNHTSDEIGFFGLEIEVWKISDSAPAPKFNVVAKPNEWTKPVPTRDLTPAKRAQLDFWRGFRDYAASHAKRISPTAPRPQYWMGMSMGRGGFTLSAVASTWEDDGRPGIRTEFVMSGKLASERFGSLEGERESIHAELSETPEWYSPDGVQHRKVILRRSVDWQVAHKRTDCYAWLVEKLDRFHEVFQPRIMDLD